MSPKIKPVPVSLTQDGKLVDSYDMVDVVKQYIVELGLSLDKISEIRPSFVEIPGYVYAELGVATENHPLMGSIGVYIIMDEGYEMELQLLLYHDRNPWETHANGLPHWNQEIRLIDQASKEKIITGEKVKIVKHIINDSQNIEICCLGPDGKPIRIRTNRDDFRPIK